MAKKKARATKKGRATKKKKPEPPTASSMGKKRWAKTTREERREYARRIAQMRWSKEKNDSAQKDPE